MEVEFKMIQTGPRSGICQLYVNGEKVDELKMANLIPALYSLTETFDVGIDTGLPVSNKYGTKQFFPYTGEIDRVTIRIE